MTDKRISTKAYKRVVKYHFEVAENQAKNSTCSACDGFGSELTVYSGKILCRQCGSQKVDEKTRADLWCP